MTYLLDSNVVSLLLKGNEKVLYFVYSLVRNNSHALKIPLVAYYEIKRRLLKRKSIKNFFSLTATANLLAWSA